MTNPSSTAPPPARIDREIIRLGLVVVVGAIMALLDTTIVNVALDTLARDLKTGLSTIQWVVTGYLLALGTVIPLTGWVVDRFGAKRVWLFSIALFMLGSTLSGMAWSVGSLIGFRVVQGLGGGMLMPVAQTILARAAGPERMGRAMSIVGIPVLMAPVLGPVIGGWLVEEAHWRWIFFVNLPVGVLALALAAWLIPADHPADSVGRIDVRGLFLLPPGLVLLIYGLSTASTHGGFGDASTISWLVAGGVLVTLFTLHSLRRGERALVDVRLFADRTFTVSVISIFLFGVVMYGSMLLLPLYFQIVRGEGALAAGLLLAPQGLGAAIMMPVAGMLSDRYGVGRVVPVGVVICVAGSAVLTQVTADTSYWLLGFALLVRGFGLGAVTMPVMSAAYANLAKSAVSRATSTLNILLQVGGSFGAALLAVLLTREIDQRLPAARGRNLSAVPDSLRAQVAPVLAEAFAWTFWVAFFLMAIIIVPALLLPRKPVARDDASQVPLGG